MLPLSRNTTYVAGAPIKSADLNDMQDCIVSGKHGPVTWSYAVCGPAASGSPQEYIVSTTGGEILALPIFLPAGVTITNIDSFVGSNASTPTIYFREYNMSTGATILIGSLSIPNSATMPIVRNIPFASGSSFLTSTLKRYSIYIAATAASQRLYGAAITFSRL